MRYSESPLVEPSTRTRLRWLHLPGWTSVGVRTKMLLPLVLLLTLSLLGSIGGFLVGTTTSRAQLLKTAFDEDERRIRSALEYSQGQAQQAARLLADLRTLQNALLDEQAASDINESLSMNQMVVPVRERLHLDQIIVLDSDGHARVNIAPTHLEAISVRGAEMLGPCAAQQSQLAVYTDEEKTLRHLLIVCAPIRSEQMPDAASQTIGWVYTVLDLAAWLTTTRRDLELVVDPRIVGRWQADTPPSQTSAPAAADLHQRLVDVPVGSADRLRLNLLMDTGDIDAIVDTGLQAMLLCSALALLVSFMIVALIVQGVLLQPIVNLTAVAERVARGDLQARASIKSGDEIGRLAGTFNTMTAELHELVSQLEQRVEERTSELTRTNEQLREEIRERQSAEEQIRRQKTELERLATTDELTGLYNRRHFFTLSTRELTNARLSACFVSAVMLDIDHFKRINDTYGHACGDQVLRVAARRCRENVRDTDIVGRYGGEEFAILLPMAGLEMAYRIAERLRSEMANNPIETDQGPIEITASLGIASSGRDGLDLAQLLDQADAALYQAKRSGRNRVIIAEQY